MARRADGAARDHATDPPARAALRAGVEHHADQAGRSIVSEAVAPFYDATLAQMVASAKSDWEDRAREALDEQLGDEHRAALHGYLAEQLEAIRAQLEEIEDRARLSTADLQIELPPIEIPDPEVDESLEGKPLLSSRWPWAEQTRALMDRKRYGNSAGAAP
jgi:hypothetical protein